MGDVASGHISKGVIHQEVDAVVNHWGTNGAFDKRAAFVNAIKNADTPAKYFDVLETQAGASRPQTTYLKDTFYSVPNVWWPGITDIYAVFHIGSSRHWKRSATVFSSTPTGCPRRAPRPSRSSSVRVRPR